jgi:hypothetical protein
MGDFGRLELADAHESAHVLCMSLEQNRGPAKRAALVAAAAAHQVRSQTVMAFDLAGLGHFESLQGRFTPLVFVSHYVLQSAQCQWKNRPQTGAGIIPIGKWRVQPASGAIPSGYLAAPAATAAAGLAAAGAGERGGMFKLLPALGAAGGASPGFTATAVL